VTKVTDPVGRQLSYGYDMNGIDLLTVSNTTPPTNDLLVRVTKYNGMHEPLSVTATNGQVTNYDYNSYGQRTTSTDPLNRKWTNVYDGSGYFLRIDGPTPGSPPEIATTQYTFKYDDQAANGTLINRVTRVFDAIGRLQRFSYDNAD